MKLKNDYYGNKIELPQIGDSVLRDGYKFTVNEVFEINDLFQIASISLKGESGSVGVGYYDYLLHKKP